MHLLVLQFFWAPPPIPVQFSFVFKKVELGISYHFFNLRWLLIYFTIISVWVWFERKICMKLVKVKCNPICCIRYWRQHLCLWSGVCLDFTKKIVWSGVLCYDGAIGSPSRSQSGHGQSAHHLLCLMVCFPLCRVGLQQPTGWLSMVSGKWQIFTQQNSDNCHPRSYLTFPHQLFMSTFESKLDQAIWSYWFNELAFMRCTRSSENPNNCPNILENFEVLKIDLSIMQNLASGANKSDHTHCRVYLNVYRSERSISREDRGK